MHEVNLLPTEKNEPTNYSKQRKCSLQFPAAISACLIRLGFGTVIYWPSPALPHLTSTNSKFTITPDEASLVVSIFTVGSIIGALISVVFVNRFGRKYTMLLFGIPQVLSWITIYYATNVFYLYVARILAGIGYAAGSLVEIIYVGEIAEKKIRGFLVVIGKLAFVFGSVIVFALAASVSYDNMNLILLFVSLIFILTFSFMPESPYFYLKVNREEDAFQSLAKLRGIRDTSVLQLEIDKIKEGMMENVSNQLSLVKLLRVKSNHRALLICTLAFISSPLSGSTVIATRTQTILGHIDSPLKAEQASVVIMVIVLVSSIFMSPLPDWLGRRTLTLCYGIIVALSCVTMGGSFFYKYYLEGHLSSSLYWIPLIAFFIHIICGNCGLFSLSQILLSELFSIEIKNSAASVIHIFWSIMEFFLQLSFEKFVSAVEIYGAFWIYGIVSFIIILINYVIMPETKGKTLEEIQRLLNF